MIDPLVIVGRSDPNPLMVLAAAASVGVIIPDVFRTREQERIYRFSNDIAVPEVPFIDANEPTVGPRRVNRKAKNKARAANRNARRARRR